MGFSGIVRSDPDNEGFKALEECGVTGKTDAVQMKEDASGGDGSSFVPIDKELVLDDPNEEDGGEVIAIFVGVMGGEFNGTNGGFQKATVADAGCSAVTGNHGFVDNLDFGNGKEGDRGFQRSANRLRRGSHD